MGIYSNKLCRGSALLAVLFIAGLLQGCITVKCGNGNCDKDCGEPGVAAAAQPGVVGQGNCFKHRVKTWSSDAVLAPNCASGYVCNSLGGPCSDAAKANGTCRLNPSSGTCDCRCM